MASGGRYKWWLLLLLGAAYFLHQADRALFGLLTIPIQNDLGLSDVQIGWINTALSWTIAVVTPLAGVLGNRLSGKWTITVSLVFWSLATMAMGFAGEWSVFGAALSSFAVVMMLRSLATGGGESFYGPAAMALIASHHTKTRSTAFSLHQAALYLGLMSCGALSAAALGLLGSWRRVFVLFGLVGIALGAVFVFALKDGTKEAEERPMKAAGFLEALGAYFLNPSALLATSGFVAIVFVNNAYLFWAPKFMAVKFNVDVGAAGRSAMFYHHLFAFAAIFAGGWITDLFVRRMPRFRLGFQIASLLLGAPAIYLMGRASTMGGMIAMTAVYGVFRGLFEVNTHASVFDVVPANCRSSTVGFMLLLAFFFGGLSGVAMGALSDKYGVEGFEMGFAVMAFAYVVAAALMAVSFFFTFSRARCKLNSM